MNKKKWIVTLILCIIAPIIGIFISIKMKEMVFLYIGIGFDIVLLLAIMINIVIPDWLDK